ncbi:uncharacterized protein [Arachis hypogaea]|uniref:uncharacterized protein n=1 Tax=Arachis hypogaea TaxID=3818 RepID=UPI003B212A6A
MASSFATIAGGYELVPLLLCRLVSSSICIVIRGVARWSLFVAWWSFSLLCSALFVRHLPRRHSLCLANSFLNQLSPSLHSSLPQIALNCTLAAAIFRLGHGASYATVVHHFKISLTESYRAFFTVYKVMSNKLGHLFTLRIDSEKVMSKLFFEIEEFRELLEGPSYKLSDGSLTPQVNEKDSFGSAKIAFNCAHARAMRLVGDAFRRLRIRWQLLSDSRKWKGECVEYLPYVIVTYCLLQNFLIKCNEPMPVKEVRIVEKERADDVASNGVVDENAIRIRDALAMHLSRVSLRG